MILRAYSLPVDLSMHSRTTAKFPSPKVLPTLYLSAMEEGTAGYSSSSISSTAEGDMKRPFQWTGWCFEDFSCFFFLKKEFRRTLTAGAVSFVHGAADLRGRQRQGGAAVLRALCEGQPDTEARFLTHIKQQTVRVDRGDIFRFLTSETYCKQSEASVHEGLWSLVENFLYTFKKHEPSLTWKRMKGGTLFYFYYWNRAQHFPKADMHNRTLTRTFKLLYKADAASC